MIGIIVYLLCGLIINIGIYDRLITYDAGRQKASVLVAQLFVMAFWPVFVIKIWIMFTKFIIHRFFS
jgi:hypothetical protein